MTDFVGTYFTCAAVPGWLSKGTDGDGVRWKMHDLTGWDEPPDARDSFVARPNSNGAFDAPVYDDARTVSWMGTLIAPSRSAREACKMTLSRLARALRDGVDVVGHDESGDKTVRAKRSPGWKIAPFGPYGLQYQATIVCPDPYKYGPEVTASTGLPAPGAGGLRFPLFKSSHKLGFGLPGVSGRVTIANAGTSEATLTFTINGEVIGGFTATEVDTGRVITYSGDVADGASVLVIDSAYGHAYLNGSLRDSELTSKQWWTVPPGGSSTIQFATLGVSGQSGTFTASLKPTYL